jgi:hypothetical protein
MVPLFKKENYMSFITHGLTKSEHGPLSKSTYGTWSSMMKRCYNPNNNRYHIYGARGITVCDRWRESPLNLVTTWLQR